MSPYKRSTAILMAFVLHSFGATASWAATQAKDSSPSVSPVPKTLFEALPHLRWDSSSRGALLIVAPKTLGAIKTTSKSKPVPPTLVSGVYRIPDLLDYFGCRSVRLKGLTIIAPAEMTVLNTKLGKPDIYASMPSVEKMQLLEGMFTPAQWKIFTGPNGIGRGDMDDKQRQLLDSILPDPFMYSARSTGSNLDETSEFSTNRQSLIQSSVIKTISNTQRSQIRLRIHRETSLSLPPADNSGVGLAGTIARSAPGTSQRSMYQAFDPEHRKYYGATLTETVPSRLKAGQLDFDASTLDVRITITDAATVGDLIDRIRAATRVEIYGDRRLTRLPIWLQTAGLNARLRAGDVLKALCWGVSGAVRYVRGSNTSGVFILTDDVEGLGTRWAKITEWTMGASNVEHEVKNRNAQVIRQQNLIESIGFAPDEKFTPTPEQMQQIEKAWSNFDTRRIGVPFPISVLPTDLQERIRQISVETNAARAQNPKFASMEPPVSDSKVNIAVRVELNLEVPEVGSIPLSAYGGLDTFLPAPDYREPTIAAVPMPKTIALPPKAKIGGVLSVTPTTEEEARIAVRAARAHGLTQVWIAALPDREDASLKYSDPESRRIIAAAIQEAQTDGRPLTVLAVVRVLSTPPQMENNLPANVDINLKGQRSGLGVRSRLKEAQLAEENTRILEKENRQARDWLLPDSSGAIANISARLSEIAATPGLGGIVLADVIAPGYRYTTNSLPSQNSNYSDVGYTPDQRIAAIRTFGCDPIDITLERGYISAWIPGPKHFEDNSQQIAMMSAKAAPPVLSKGAISALADTSPFFAWNALRYQTTQGLLDRLYTQFADKAGQEKPFVVYLGSMGRLDSPEWFGTWDQRDKLPFSPGFYDNQMARREKAARTLSSAVLYCHGYIPMEDIDSSERTADVISLTPAEKYARDFNDRFRQGGMSWDGYVFDLRDQKMNAVVELLQNISPANSSEHP